MARTVQLKLHLFFMCKVHKQQSFNLIIVAAILIPPPQYLVNTPGLGSRNAHCYKNGVVEC